MGCKISVSKRMMDVIISFTGLVAMSPVFLIVACFIKKVSPGPVFFRQKRVGYEGKYFMLLKFRTMSVNHDQAIHQNHVGGMLKSGDVPLIKVETNVPYIPLGKFLRSSAIDELPQLFNVLRGEMSLVGPRPCISYEAEDYLRWNSRRFDITPGLTGLWQVSGKNRTTFKEMIRLDMQYASEVSFFLDARIILKTPRIILSQVFESVVKKKSGISKEQNITINKVEVA